MKALEIMAEETPYSPINQLDKTIELDDKTEEKETTKSIEEVEDLWYTNDSKE